MKNVALVLASGGPRGFAYIGAIEELLSRGYNITSVAGASAGSLVGGIYAAGGLEPFKKWLFGLDPMKVMILMDVSVGKNHFLKGEKVIREIKDFVPEVNIEDLPIPFTAIATDLFTGEEVIFRKGPLFRAVRASISIPSMFKPGKWKGRTLVDGGMVNTFPLNRVKRTPGDILVGFNVNQIDAAEIQGYLDSRAAIVAERESEHTLLGRIQAGFQQHQLEVSASSGWIPVGADDNFASILQRSFGIMNCSLARMAIEHTPPDVLASLPYDSYHGVYGYTRAEEIATLGRKLMAEALDQYEKKNA